MKHGRRPNLRAHARLGPSAAHRWAYCPGSVFFIEDNCDADEGSDIANEGSILHSFMEDCLRSAVDAYTFIGETRTYEGYTYTLDEDTADLLQQGLDEIDTIPGKLYVERRVDLSRWMPGQFGTLDVGILGKKWVTIWDHKFGYIPVSPVENDQEQIYALGFWDNLVRKLAPNLEWFRLIIFQPRGGGGGGEWEIHLDDLLDYGDWIEKRAEKALTRGAKRVAGKKQCSQCPAAKNLTCPEYNRYQLELIIEDFDDDEFDEQVKDGLPLRMSKASGMTPERRSFIIENRPIIVKWLDRLQADCLDDALKGRPTPGLKAILGRKSPDKWKDSELAAIKARLIRMLDDEAFIKKMITPSQARGLLSDNIFRTFKSMLIEGSKKPVLVPAMDARPAVPTIADEFDDDD